jgi:hypothetical protein
LLLLCALQIEACRGLVRLEDSHPQRGDLKHLRAVGTKRYEMWQRRIRYPKKTARFCDAGDNLKENKFFVFIGYKEWFFWIYDIEQNTIFKNDLS